MISEQVSSDIMQPMMDRAAEFKHYRPLLFSIAYHMLGRAMDAEDIVQETWLRWQQAGADEVESTKAYLSTISTRLCIDHLRSAQVKREQYIGPWLPEPILTSQDSTMLETTELAESLALAFLVVLETLSPIERAIFLLHEVFDYDYAEVARIVGKSEANCRQIASRAKQHVAAKRPRFTPSREEQEQLTRQFVETCTNGDLEGLIALLAENAVAQSDGGGKVIAARQPVYGANKVARFVLGIVKRIPPDYAVQPAEVNGQPALIGYYKGQPYNVLTLDIAEGHIVGVYNVLNPDKLRGIPPLAT